MGLFVFDLIVKALAESFRHLILDAIPDQFHNVSCTVQNRLAMGACLEVSLQARAQLRSDLPIQIIGDLPPYLQAAYFNHTHRIPRDPLSFTTGALPWPHFFKFLLARAPASIDPWRQGVAHLEPCSQEPGLHVSFCYTQNLRRFLDAQV